MVYIRVDSGRQQCFKKRAAFDLFASVASYEEERRRIRRAEQFADERCAVCISPLQIVDEEHNRFFIRESIEEFPQCGEGSASEFLRVGYVDDLPSSALNRFDLTKYRKESRKSRDLSRHIGFRFKRWKSLQISTQSID